MNWHAVAQWLGLAPGDDDEREQLRSARDRLLIERQHDKAEILTLRNRCNELQAKVTAYAFDALEADARCDELMRQKTPDGWEWEHDRRVLAEAEVRRLTGILRRSGIEATS